MRLPRWAKTVDLVLVGLGVATALAVGGSSAWLTARYRPTAAGGDLATFATDASDSAAGVDRHRILVVALVVVAVLVLAVTPAVVARVGRGPERPVAVGLIALLGLAGALAALLTLPLVLWDQVALRSVTVGADLSGWGLAAFDDRVLFVLVDGVEVSPGTYAVSLVGHLAAPALTAVALVVVGVLVRRTDG